MVPEIPKLRELRVPNTYPLVISSIKKIFSHPTQSYKVAGWLKQFKTNWRTITSDQEVLQTVTGSRVEWFETFRQVKPPQGQKFLTSEKELIEKEIKELEEREAI